MDEEPKTALRRSSTAKEHSRIIEVAAAWMKMLCSLTKSGGLPAAPLKVRLRWVIISHLSDQHLRVMLWAVVFALHFVVLLIGAGAVWRCKFDESDSRVDDDKLGEKSPPVGREWYWSMNKFGRIVRIGTLSGYGVRVLNWITEVYRWYYVWDDNTN